MTSVLMGSRRYPLHKERLGAGMQLESIHYFKSRFPVEGDSDVVARSDHHVGGVLSPSPDLREELLNQECARTSPSGIRIDGHRQQLRTLDGTTGAVTKGLDDPTP